MLGFGKGKGSTERHSSWIFSEIYEMQFFNRQTYKVIKVI